MCKLKFGFVLILLEDSCLDVRNIINYTRNNCNKTNFRLEFFQTNLLLCKKIMNETYLPK